MLSVYHQIYEKLSDQEIGSRLKVKDMGLRQVFATLGLPRVDGPHARVLVLGCADKRFVPGHVAIFSAILQKPVKLTTIDVSLEHLAGAEGVILHDAAEPLPFPPYEVVYGDVLIRFIPPDKQYAVLKNSWDALAPGGMAVHVFAKDDYDPPEDYVPLPGTNHVDFNALQLALTKDGIPYLEVPLRFDAYAPDGRRMLIDDLALVFRR